jgi:hypothetical protein
MTTGKVNMSHYGWRVTGLEQNRVVQFNFYYHNYFDSKRYGTIVSYRLTTHCDPG